ncbi:MAG: DEAD/DEAH box helicase, partial [Clostridia bacterium]|nr:DEAD/DEAH box helicase [Clostridia bacterium]
KEAWEAVAENKDIVVVTPTASGKSLCYNVPVVNNALAHPEDRTLYLFPTKALANDQNAELLSLILEMNTGIKAFTYDGDTSPAARRAVREAGQIVLTNPDMLHSGVLPQHVKWVRLFENLKYIVIDEVHTYRGVFGSHLANVLRRLMRICDFYGSKPQFICCSATIANPAELASAITGREIIAIDQNGAPAGERNFILYNPPVVNKPLGIRASSLGETRRIATDLLRNKVSTIVFARSRLQVEVLTTYLKEVVKNPIGRSDRVRGYRGGFLPNLRREIEKGLRSGDITGVVSTNALELGVDIGSLEACVLCGYPGSQASVYQQAGRAGRRQGTSAAVLVATSSALDQYYMAHPDAFFARPAEAGIISPDNLYILMNHLKCALFELPFSEGEEFGAAGLEALEYLEKQGAARHSGGKWYWTSDPFPAHEVYLRTAGSDQFQIIDLTGEKPHLLGNTDRYGAMTMLHDDAIYLHESATYQVEKLDYEEKKAYIKRAEPDYYTDSNTQTELFVLDEWESRGPLALGEVRLNTMVTLFKKIKFDTHENVGFGKVELPEVTMHTTACWIIAEGAASPAEGEGKKEAKNTQSALLGVGNLLQQLAPVFLLCDPRDFYVWSQVRAPHTQKPTIFLYDAYPGGIGLAEKLIEALPQLLVMARAAAQNCECENGCPSCVGPEGDRAAAVELLDVLAREITCAN